MSDLSIIKQMKSKMIFMVLLLLGLAVLTGCSPTTSETPDFDFSYHLSEINDGNDHSLVVAVDAYNKGGNIDYSGNIYDLFGRAELYSEAFDVTLLSIEMPVSPDATKKHGKKEKTVIKNIFSVLTLHYRRAHTC
ncbi:MAG: hypothetical protein IJS71_07830 [Clostridia bacterium]|nr:hypothetical protein [Clostridia bacterium]